MSTLSAQCDELRELAAKYDALKSGATRVVRISLDTGPVLREAADTICELRDRVQALDGENAKLRKLVADMGELLDVLSDCDMVCEHYHDGCIGDCYYVNARRELGVEVASA